MTEQQRRQICAELARRMGYTARSVGTMGYYQLHDPNGQPAEPSPVRHAPELVFTYAPDPFTSAADNRALVAWLAESEEYWIWFEQELVNKWISSMGKDKPNTALVKFVLTASRETIALCAARALGIEVE